MVYRATLFLVVLALTSCQPTSPSLSFAASQKWQFTGQETVAPIVPTTLEHYEAVSPVPRSEAPLSKFIHSPDYEVYIALVLAPSADQVTHSFSELKRRGISLVDQRKITVENTTLRQYFWQLPDQHFAVSTLYNTPREQIPVMITVVTADSVQAREQFFNRLFVQQKIALH